MDYKIKDYDLKTILKAIKYAEVCRGEINGPERYVYESGVAYGTLEFIKELLERYEAAE